MFLLAKFTAIQKTMADTQLNNEIDLENEDQSEVSFRHTDLSFGHERLRTAYVLSAISTNTTTQSRNNLIVLDNIPLNPNISKEIKDENFNSSLHYLKKISKIQAISDSTNESKISERRITTFVDFVESNDGNFIKRRHRGSISNFMPGRSRLLSRQSILGKIDQNIITIPKYLIFTGEPVRKTVCEKKHIPSEPSKKNIFTDAQIQIISYILRECLDKLVILEHLLLMKPEAHYDQSFKKMGEKYMILSDSTQTILRNKFGIQNMISNNIEKLINDRTHVSNIIYEILNDIEINGKYDSLRKIVSQISEREKYTKYLEITKKNQIDQITQLRSSIEMQKKVNESEIEKLILLEEKTNALIDYTIFINSAELGYVERWDSVRLDQKRIKLNTDEHEFLSQLNNVIQQKNVEDIVSRELITFLEENCNEMKNSVLSWINQHDEEQKKMNTLIDNMKKCVEQQKVEIEKLEILIDERKNLIDEYNIEKAHREKQNKAAIIIQAYWKSYMVRHQLGKYKKLFGKMKRIKMRKREKKSRTKRKIKQ